jgi:hypothetical protein
VITIIHKQLKIEKAREEYFKYGLYTEEEYEEKIKQIRELEED